MFVFFRASGTLPICGVICLPECSIFCGLFPRRLLKSIGQKLYFFQEEGGRMQKNEIHRLSAEKLGAEMEGVCRLNGMPVFVPGMLPGEETDVRIVKAEKRYAFGRMEAVPVVSSPDRRDPGCPVYPRCGGCSCRMPPGKTSGRAESDALRLSGYVQKALIEGRTC